MQDVRSYNADLEEAFIKTGRECVAGNGQGPLSRRCYAKLLNVHSVCLCYSFVTRPSQFSLVSLSVYRPHMKQPSPRDRRHTSETFIFAYNVCCMHTENISLENEMIVAEKP